MRVKHRDVKIRISQRILWVEQQAYPLAQVTRVQPIELRSNRRRMVLTYGGKAAATIVIAVVGLMFLGSFGQAISPTISMVFGIVMLVILVAHTVRLVRRLTRSHLYILSVASAGRPHAAVVSTNKELVHDLSTRVIDAIDNPNAEFEIRVDHVEILHGDKVGGDKYGGDRVEGDKVVALERVLLKDPNSRPSAVKAARTPRLIVDDLTAVDNAAADTGHAGPPVPRGNSAAARPGLLSWLGLRRPRRPDAVLSARRELVQTLADLDDQAREFLGELAPLTDGSSEGGRSRDNA